MYFSPVAKNKRSICLLVSICCAYLLSPVFQLGYIPFISRSQYLTNLVSYKFDNHTAVVLLPSVDNQASKSVKKTYNNKKRGILLLPNELIY